MNQQVPVVHQDPLSGIVTLYAHGAFAYLLELGFDFIADRLALFRICN